MQFNDKSADNSSNQITVPESPLIPSNNSERRYICQKITEFCYCCGSGWLFDKPGSTKSFESSDRYMWCNSDICGSICALFTWLLILNPCFVFLFVVFIPVDSNYFRFINGFIFYSLALMAVLSHIKSVFTDPGTVPKGNATEENIKALQITDKPMVRCVKCNSIKPMRAHHCSVCKRCIRKMDHHCPWINNCVGEDNQKYFIMFTFYIFLMSAFALYICIHFFIFSIKDEWQNFFQNKEIMIKNWFEFSPLTKSLLLLSVAFESFIFGLFTLIMCITQLCSIAKDRTGIESLIRESPKWERRSCWVNISSVFNEPFSWRWFCPLALNNYKTRNYENELHVV